MVFIEVKDKVRLGIVFIKEEGGRVALHQDRILGLTQEISSQQLEELEAHIENTA